jgi:hypothetical protein
MNPFYLPASGSPATDWLVFAAMLLAMGIPVFCFVLWLLVLRSGAKKKRRRKHKHRHRRQVNPTLADTGGLPPKRDPDEAPPGV